jgi:hypothetical protein
MAVPPLTTCAGLAEMVTDGKGNGWPGIASRQPVTTRRTEKQDKSVTGRRPSDSQGDRIFIIVSSFPYSGTMVLLPTSIVGCKTNPENHPVSSILYLVHYISKISSQATI